MKSINMKSKHIIAPFVLFALILLFLSCEKPSNEPNHEQINQHPT